VSFSLLGSVTWVELAHPTNHRANAAHFHIHVVCVCPMSPQSPTVPQPQLPCIPFTGPTQGSTPHCSKDIITRRLNRDQVTKALSILRCLERSPRPHHLLSKEQITTALFQVQPCLTNQDTGFKGLM
jgi:hypothetical protein